MSSFRTCFLLASLLLTMASCAARQDVDVEPRSSRLVLSPGLWVEPDARRLGFRAWVCLDEGWLEQVVCGPGTREHESLMVSDVPASGIHAGLLLLGLEPGRPGRWREEGAAVVALPPQGPGVRVAVRWIDESGRERSDGVDGWIRDVSDGASFPTDRWIFAGSIELDGRDAEQAGVRYLADRSGSIIGLVTFGDELLAAGDVIPDAADVHAPEWIAATSAVPPVGTEVTVELSVVGPDQTAAE